MENRKCDLQTDCLESQSCLLSEQRCVNHDDSFIGFELNKKVYYAKSVEEIEEAVQQFVAMNTLDFDALKCTVGMNFEDDFETFVGKSASELRKELAESKENPINIISMINASDGSVYCENLKFLKQYVRQKLNDKNFNGFVHNKNLNEGEIKKLKEKVLQNPERGNLFSNFPLLSTTFVICDHELVNNLNTIVYYIVKLTNVKWRDINFGMSAYHNEITRGDDVHVLIPVGDRKFYCNKFKGKCQSIFWNTEQDKPLSWDNGFVSREECEKRECKKHDELYDKLYQSILNNNTIKVKKILSYGFPILDKYDFLHIACSLNNLDIVKLFVDTGYDFNKKGKGGLTPLHTTTSIQIAEFNR